MRPASKLIPALVLLPLLLTACKPGGETASQAPSENAPTSAPAPAPASKTLKIALITPGPISDAGWNASAYEGLMLIRKTLGAEVKHQQTDAPGEFEAAFRDFAQHGYNLIFAHGNEYGEAMTRVAKDFPNTTFAISSGGVKGKNIVSMVFDLGQATYLCGEIAALMSKTGKTGCVGGIELPSVKSTFISYEGGAHAANPKTKVTTVYTNSFEDQTAGKQATVALINAGNDFIFHNADQAGLGVIKAIQENKAKGVYGFGSNKNQNALAPDVILASAVLDVPEAFLTVAKAVQEKGVQGGEDDLGMKEGVVTLEYNDKLKSKIPASVLKKVEDDKKAIIAGTLHVPRGSL
jgi:basic membrane lipoprotein Med (substrate-binding protein (PBP1-ABC) superfamily)